MIELAKQMFLRLILLLMISAIFRTGLLKNLITLLLPFAFLFYTMRRLVILFAVVQLFSMRAVICIFLL